MSVFNLVKFTYPTAGEIRRKTSADQLYSTDSLIFIQCGLISLSRGWPSDTLQAVLDAAGFANFSPILNMPNFCSFFN